MSALPLANQAQIIRANQRDLFHVASLREQLETLLRSAFGTRWLLRWDKEIELFAKLVYFGLTTRYASQTLGEEYTDLWQLSSSWRLSSRKLRSTLVLLSALPPYLLSRLIPRLNAMSAGTWSATYLAQLPTAIDILSEVNLAIFYFTGTYHDLIKRLLRIRYISTTPPNPNVTPPSYSLLGAMLAIRLAYRSIAFMRSSSSTANASLNRKGKQAVNASSSGEPVIDARPVSSILATVSAEEKETVPAEEDERTVLHIAELSSEERASRRCTLCLEERTSTSATECGHLFCWDCISGWGREKPECPLCRQSLNLTRLLPVYNL